MNRLLHDSFVLFLSIEYIRKDRKGSSVCTACHVICEIFICYLKIVKEIHINIRLI